MNKKNLLQISITAIVVAVALGLVVAQAALAGSTDPTKRWAWGTNVGWLNFAPAVGADTSHAATVYADHLEGYAWAENVGWIHLGTHIGGGAHTYSNTSNTDYGVNRDDSGNLSGFAWSSSVGWIKFNPANGGVTIDLATCDFTGSAWGENIGWIQFGGTAVNGAAYGVTSCVAAAPRTALGSVKGDGVVNSTDALIILSADAGINTSQFCPMNCGDVDGDGFVNSTDALIILSYDAGMTVPFPVGQSECPASVTAPPGCTP